MACALAYAKREPNAYSLEMDALTFLERFGAQALFGGPVPLKFLRRMQTAETIVHAQRAHAAAENGADWAAKNPNAFALLTRALRTLESTKP